MDWVACLQERGEHGPHALIVFAEDCLEHCEVKLTHLEDYLVEDIQELSLGWVLLAVKYRWQQGLDDHVVAVEHFLRQDH